MSVGFREFGGNALASTATLNCSLPSTRQVGDILLLCVVVYANTTITLTTNSAGWTQIGTTQTFFGSARSSAVFWKVSTGAEGNPTAALGTTAAAGFSSVAYMGVDSTSPINAFAFSNDSDASTTNMPAPALTTTALARAVLFAHGDSNATPPSGFVERTELQSTARIQLCDRGPDYAAGSIGGWTPTQASAAQHGVWSIALKEDATYRLPAYETPNTGSNATTGTSSVTPNTPTAIQNGDLMLFALLLDSPTVTVSSIPSGWTLLDSTFSGQATLYTYWKIYDGTIGTFNFSGTSTHRHTNLRFTSLNTLLATPLGGNSEGSALASGTVTVPSVTPTIDGLVITVIGAASATASQSNSLSTPAGLYSIVTGATTGSGGSMYGWIGSFVTAGQIGVATATPSGTLTNAWDWSAQTIVIASQPLVKNSLAVPAGGASLSPVARKHFIEALVPDAVVSQTNLSGAVANVQDDPDAGGDVTWLAVV